MKLTEFQLTDPDGWFEILLPGEFPNKDQKGDRTEYVLQVVTPQGMEEMVADYIARGRPEVLIDTDHLSRDANHNTEAMGWVTDLRISNNRLQAKGRWTSKGLEALTGGTFRKASIEMACRDEPDQPPTAGMDAAQPLRTVACRFQGVALTNRPNIPGLRPLSNRAPAGAGGGNNETTNPTNKRMNPELLALLGLSDTATPEEVLGAVTALKDAAAAAQTAKETEADNTMKEYENCVPAEARPMLREGLLKNREVTLKVLNGLKAAATPAPEPRRVHNREAVGTQGRPDFTGTQNQTQERPKTEAEKAARQDALIRSVMNRQGCGRTAAFDIARGENPEVFDVKAIA